MPRRSRSPLLAAVVLLSAGGCGDLLRPEGGEVGVVSLSWSGAESGRFTVRGVRPDNWDERSHAAGLREPDRVSVSAYRVESRTTASAFWISASVPGPGTYPFSDGHGAGVVRAELVLDAVRTGSTARAIYVLTAGSLVLHPERRDRRIRGTFSGTARRLDGTETIQVAGGAFDVPDNLPRPVD
jgi:hypothetical protein